MSFKSGNEKAIDISRGWERLDPRMALYNARTEQSISFSLLEHRVQTRVAERATVLKESGLSNPVVIIEVEDDIDALVDLFANARLNICSFLVRPRSYAQRRISCAELSKFGLDGVFIDNDIHRLEPSSPLTRVPRVLLQSGGTTGRPRAIPVDFSPSALNGMRNLFLRSGWRTDMRQLSVLPLHHAAGLIPSVLGLLDGHSVFFPGRVFNPEVTLQLVGRESLQWACLTPTHMRRMAAEQAFDQPILDSLEGMIHTAAPCDHATKLKWINRLGSERVHEFASSTEQVGVTYCSGAEWLEHPGTVGRGFLTKINVRHADGSETLPYEPGEVFMRSLATARRTQLVGVKQASDGALSVGDYGYLDSDGFLFLIGRNGDMFTVGGENVYPVEIEQAILELEGVADALVRPRKHATLGALPVAFIVRERDDLTEEEIRSHCRLRLPPPARPHGIEFVNTLPRTELGKIARKDLT